jgi:hypothetical protein
MITDAQKEARTRNWKIYLLRAMYTQIECMHLPVPLETKALAIINEILVFYNADTEQIHRLKLTCTDTFQ